MTARFQVPVERKRAESLSLEILGTALPQPRARVGRGRVYNTPRSKAWKEAVGWWARKELGPLGPMLGPLRLWIVVEQNNIRGDWDNYGKAVSDALNKIAWADDRQVKIAEVRLEEANGKPDRVLIRVEPLSKP